MSDLKKAIEGKVTQADWEKMAEHAGVSAEELQAKLVSALEKFEAGDTSAGPQVTLLERTEDGECESQRFEITLWEIIGVSGTLTLCGTSTTDWSATLQFCLVVAGSDVWCTSYTFDSHNLQVCYDINAGIAKTDICFTLQFSSSSICLNLSGEACVWTFGWHCSDFNVTPFCLPLP